MLKLDFGAVVLRLCVYIDTEADDTGLEIDAAGVLQFSSRSVFAFDCLQVHYFEWQREVLGLSGHSTSKPVDRWAIALTLFRHKALQKPCDKVSHIHLPIDHDPPTQGLANKERLGLGNNESQLT